MSEKNADGFFETVKTIAFAGLIAIGVRSLAFEPFNIPSGSMIPTLLVGDYLFVSKYSYGYSRYSLPFGLPLIPGRVLFTEPERGDVAVFKLPTDNKTDYIKRIIGLPGDRIQVRRGILHINGAPVIRKRISDFVETNQYGNVVRVARFEETLPGGRKHEILEITDNGPLDNTDLYIVPAGHYFAMGDNRDNSQDSRVRSAVGFIPKANLVGRAEVLFYSTNGAARWYQFWKWPVAMRFKRFFQGVT